MAKLLYRPCKCIRAAHAFRPGSVGHLVLRTKNRTIPVSRCPRCK